MRSFLDFLKVALASILFDVSKIHFILFLRRREGIMEIRSRGAYSFVILTSRGMA